jgi:regulator of sigma E protease
MSIMDLMTNLTTIVAFIGMLIILVFVHELGHFMVAVWMKIRVEEFGIGYPPRALTLFEHKGVKYTLNWLPLGGFVRFAGEDSSVYGAGSLAEAKPLHKIPVMLAGPLMNLVLAILIFATIFAVVGIEQQTGRGQYISKVFEDTPAEQAGFQTGDVLVSLDQQSVMERGSITEIGHQNEGETISAVIFRDGEKRSLTVTPGPWKTPDGSVLEGGFGFQYGPEKTYEPVGVVGAIGASFVHTGDVVFRTVTGFGKLIGGLIHVSEPVDGGLVGPIGIARATGEVIEQGGLTGFFNWMAILSIMLFVINLLPIPALDGGHILFALIEVVRGGKRIPPEKEAVVNAISFLTLMGLIFIVSVSDVIAAFQRSSVLGGG